MYRIMLVDDEGLERNALKRIIEKHFGDECTLETAKSGRDAIEQYERFRPDITFMDIQMPGINGIDAMREIRSHHPEARFIVLTAFDNFDYAQESISLGVFSYLTKPIRRDMVVQSLRKLMGEIGAERQQRSNHLLLREKLETALPMLEAGFIYSILLRQDRDSVMKNYLQMLDIQQESGYFLVLEFQTENSPEDSVALIRVSEKIRSLIRELFHNSITQLVGMRSLTAVFCNPPQDEYDSRLQSIERVTELQRRMEGITDLTFVCGVGSIQPLKNLADSYDQAIAALQQHTGEIAHFNDLPLMRQWESGYPYEAEHQVCERTEQGDVQGALQAAETFFDWMERCHGADLNDVRLKALALVLQAEDIAFHTGGQVYHFMGRHGYWETLGRMEHLAELRDWYLERIRAAVSSISDKREASTLSNVEKAKQYIDRNYSRELTLNEVSRQVHVSPYYFSKIFKEETGQNFIEYLTQTRMEQAKFLLRTSSMSIKEICFSIGYSDPNYFSRSFKRYEGMTPREYRERSVEA